MRDPDKARIVTMRVRFFWEDIMEIKWRKVVRHSLSVIVVANQRQPLLSPSS